MSEILFLAHRIPYPPDKGDKIRSYHLLKALAERHTVHLGTFVDDAADWRHVDALRKLCRGETCIRPLNPRMARLRGASGFLTGDPLTLAYYRDPELRHWSERLVERRRLAGVFAFSSSMGQYAERLRLPSGAPHVLDLCDVDSDKWRQYAAGHRLPMSIVYRREASRLESLEARYLESFDATLVISDAEADILRRSARHGSDRIRVVPNGVDTSYFDPSHEFMNPFDPASRPIVFTGAMDYHANVDGVRWFVAEVWPIVRKHMPRTVFAIVGSNPTPEVRDLGAVDGVVVTGRVPDVRPYLAHAAVVVAPLRLARGVQNKVLEALAMARPVVATPNAVQGIPCACDAGIRIATDAGHVAREIGEILIATGEGDLGRRFVRQRYDWGRHLEDVCRLFGSERFGDATMTGMEAACS